MNFLEANSCFKKLIIQANIFPIFGFQNKDDLMKHKLIYIFFTNNLSFKNKELIIGQLNSLNKTLNPIIHQKDWSVHA